MQPEVIVLGAGCYWCTESVFSQIPGVISSVSGFMGGHVDNPTYEQVCGKQTGHVEVTRITFDSSVVTLEQLLDLYWQMHDPTSMDRQGGDAGPQYRSAIFYTRPEQLPIIEASKNAAQPQFADPIVTQILPAATFYPAEIDHQDYYRLNKDRNPYCRLVIQPKLEKLGLQT